MADALLYQIGMDAVTLLRNQATPRVPCKITRLGARPELIEKDGSLPVRMVKVSISANEVETLGHPNQQRASIQCLIYTAQKVAAGDETDLTAEPERLGMNANADVTDIFGVAWQTTTLAAQGGWLFLQNTEVSVDATGPTALVESLVTYSGTFNWVAGNA